jgi:hypothetical protein
MSAQHSRTVDKEALAKSLEALSQVPLEMRQSPNWVGWKLTQKEGKPKPTKEPLQPRNPQYGADTTKPEHWGTLEEALAGKIQANLDGVGYVFTGTPHAGVDLDNAFDDSGALHPWAAEIVKRFEDCAYIEWSPSGTGLHLITAGSLPSNAWHKIRPVAKHDPGIIEAYDRGRYFTVTGKPYADFSGLEIGDGQAALDWLQAKYAKAKAEPQKGTRTDPETMGLEDQIVIDKARQAANGDKFDALMRGDLSEHGDDRSGADMALCSILAFWTRDPAQIDRIFRQSVLMREKWDSRRGAETYGERTIQKALDFVEPGESDWNPNSGQKAGKDAAKEAHARECLAGIFNGADLLEMDLPEVRWAVPELLPQGLAILAGGPKLGKSWLIYSICLGMGAGCRVLGNFQTPQAKSLYLALEDGKRRLQDRLKALCRNEPAVKAGLANVDFQINWPRFDDEGGLEKLEAYVEEKVREGLKLVVIDTLAKVGPKAKSKGLNAYENDSIIMTRIKSMADKHGICILIVTHLSKVRTSKDPFDSITGSMGQFGTADTAMLLTRRRGAPTAILQTTGRDIEGHSYDLAWSNPGWSCTGFANEDEVDLSPERLAILQVFKDHGEPVSSGMVAAETGKTVSSTSKLIKKLVEEGFLFPCGYGLYSVHSGQSVQSGKTIQSGQSGKSSDCPSFPTFPTFPSGLIPDEVTI